MIRILRRLKTNALLGDLTSRLTVAKAVSLFNRLARSDWNTRLLETYRHGVSVAGYPAKYVCGSPISGRRIERVSADEVTFWYRDHRDGRQKLMRVTLDRIILISLIGSIVPTKCVPEEKPEVHSCVACGSQHVLLFDIPARRNGDQLTRPEFLSRLRRVALDSS